MNDKHLAIDRIRTEMLEFRVAFDNLLLATLSADGIPEASAAPMVHGDDGEFYVFVSGLAPHTGNMRRSGRAGILLIEPMGAAQNAFARRRLSYQCRVETVPRDSSEFERMLDRFMRKFGEIVETLKSLPDFELIRLTPVSGTYVRGFGQAWRLTGEGLNKLEHINPSRKPNA